LVKELFAQDSSLLEATDYSRTTPVFMTVHMGHLEIVKFLLENGASTEVKRLYYSPLLILAVAIPNPDT
jgi:ankyrin repeat protein